MCAESQSAKQTQFPALSLSFTDNICDGPNHCVEVPANRIPFQRSHFSECYIKFKLGAVLQFDTSLCGCIRYFIFFAVKKESLVDPQGSRSANHFDVGQFDSHDRCGGNNNSVLRGYTEFVDCEEQIDSSAVRLETVKQPRDLCREAYAAPSYATFEVVSGFTEGEVDLIDGQAQESSDGDCREVEGSPKILNSVDCPLCKAAWERFTQLDLVVFMNSVRIRLDKREAWCSLEVNPKAPFKIGKFFLCPLEPEP